MKIARSRNQYSTSSQSCTARPRNRSVPSLWWERQPATYYFFHWNKIVRCHWEQCALSSALALDISHKEEMPSLRKATFSSILI